VFPIPGASAALAALTLAGLPTDRFLFAGFPPPKSAARRTFFEELANVRATLIFYEGASRVDDSLADMAAVFGAASRRGGPRTDQALRDLHPRHAGRPGRRPALRGPQGRDRHPGRSRQDEVATADDAEAALREAMARLPLGEAASEVAKALGLSRKDLYRQALALKEAR
jgi:16S rRNA (cytidine1402-2'-O)-methyltransferase